MEMKEKQKLEWRRLDNSAKIFPISGGKKYSTVFRLSVVLKENIDKKILEKATKKALEKYKCFKVRMNYLEENTKEPIIEIEKDYPCKYINPKENNNYLFKITYFERKINIDIFHSLTDGNSGELFFIEIIYCYLEMKYSEAFTQELRTMRKIDYNTEDSYMKNYSKKSKGRASSKKAYGLKGKKLKLGAVSAIHEIIDIEDLKRTSKEAGATITQYLTAVLIKIIYEKNYKKHLGKRPIKICIPVNLKKYFNSNTISNFFSYITIEANMKKHKLETFEQILELVKKEFKEKLTQEEIKRTMSANVKLGTNPFIRGIPLILKKPIVKLSYIEIRKYTTTTFSNIGRIGIIGAYQEYIEDFFMLIAPEQFEKIKCSACSFGEHIVFTFTSVLQEAEIEREFYNFLIQKGIKVKIESNGVLDVISSKTKQKEK